MTTTSSTLALSPTHLSVPFYPDKTDQCGPSSLASVLSYWGKTVRLEDLRKAMYVGKLHGTLPMDLLSTAQTYGLTVDMVRGNDDRLHAELRAGRPVIVMLDLGMLGMPVDHFIVLTGFDDNRKGYFAHTGNYKNRFIPYAAFLRQWEKTDYWTLVAGLPS